MSDYIFKTPKGRRAALGTTFEPNSSCHPGKTDFPACASLSSSSSTSSTSTSSRDKTNPSPSPSLGSAGAIHALSSGGGLSTGAKAGIGVGVGVAVISLIVLLLYLRKRRAKQGQAMSSSGEQNMSEKNARVARGQSAKSNNLPGWKSELSGVSARAELDGTGRQAELSATRSVTQRTRAELSDVRSPTELEASGVDAVERYGVPIPAEGQQNTREVEVPPDEERAELSQPPPIPYASKPRPN